MTVKAYPDGHGLGRHKNADLRSRGIVYASAISPRKAWRKFWSSRFFRRRAFLPIGRKIRASCQAT
jgi:hypothetical protein